MSPFLGFRALPSERAIDAALARVDTKITGETVSVGPVGLVTERKLSSVRTRERVGLLVIRPVCEVERIVAPFLLLFLPVHRMRDQRLAPAALEDVRVVLLAPVPGIGDDVGGQVEEGFDLVEERDQRFRVGRVRIDVIGERVLTFGCDLDVVARFQLTVLHVILFHTHERRITVGLRIAVACAEDDHVFLVSTFPGREVDGLFAEMAGLLPLRTQSFPFLDVRRRGDLLVDGLDRFLESRHDVFQLLDRERVRALPFDLRDDLVGHQLLVHLVRLLDERGVVFLDRPAPDEGVAVGVRLDFRAVDEDRLLIDRAGLDEMAPEGDESFFQDRGHSRMDAETVDRPITRLVALGEPHHPQAVLEKALDLSARERGLCVGAEDDFHHHARMIGRAARRSPERFECLVRDLFDEVMDGEGDIVFLKPDF